LEYDERLGIDAKRLIGEVIFKHEGALMYADSAYFFDGKNSLDAFGNVHINQGDTVHLYGDFLKYDGNLRKAIVTGKNLRLMDKEIDTGSWIT
jgi:lipopolysaccharide assembly outer membrane protein LptD (OstA)